MNGAVINTNIANYSYTSAYYTNLPFSIFTFRSDSTFTDKSESGTYSWIGKTEIQILPSGSSFPGHYGVSVSSNSLTLTTLKVQLHPQTDTSLEANFMVNHLMGDLHNLFSVDTSKVNSLQEVFSYSSH